MVEGRKIMARLEELGALYGEAPYKFAVPMLCNGSPFVLSQQAQEQIHELGKFLHQFFASLSPSDPLLAAGLPSRVIELGNIPTRGHPAPLLRVDAHIFPDHIEVLEMNTSAVDGFGIADALSRVAFELGFTEMDGGGAVAALVRVVSPKNESVALLVSEEFKKVAGEAKALRIFGLQGEVQNVSQLLKSSAVFPYFKPIHLKGDEPVVAWYKKGEICVVPPIKQSLDSKRNLLLARQWHEELRCFIPETTLEKPSADERKTWVAKPAHGGSCQGIFIGKGVGRAAWERSFEKETPCLFQRFSEAPEGIATGIHEDGAIELVKGKVKSNLFFANGKFVGGFATIAPGRSLINDNGFNCPLILQ